jgi:signal transduction histidine kinase
MNLANVVAFLASLGVGCGVLSANPKRAINRAFFLASVNVAAWLLSLSWLTDPRNLDPVEWIRITSAIGAFIPLFLWLIKDCAVNESLGFGPLRRGWAWIVLAVAMDAICFSNYFIPKESTRDHPLHGVGWAIFSAANGAQYIILIIQAVYDLRKVSGIRKIELQTLLFGGSSAGFVAISLIAAGPVFNNAFIPRSLPVVIVAFYSFTAWGITTQKVFDARDLFRSALRFTFSIGAVSALMVLAYSVDPAVVPRPVIVGLSAALIILVFNQFNLRFMQAALLGVDHEVEGIRSAILKAGRDEFDHDSLVRRFAHILGIWGRCDGTYFFRGDVDGYHSGRIALPLGGPVAEELLRVKWATPEALQRQRDAGGRRDLLAFMKEHRIGVMVCAPSDDGPAPFMIALGNRRDQRPFTWSEVKVLQEWVRMIETTLSRISLTQQARESEQLRTAGLLGASLAHEIRNPLVTLKTIAQSASSRYNDPEFRRLLIELVPAEIERIEGLVSGLMDLGRPQHPHFEAVHLNEVVETSVKLVRPKALDEAVTLTCLLNAAPDLITADRASIRQVILNLVMNAIQAVAMIQGNRLVRVSTASDGGVVTLEVADNGPGMPEDVRGRLFQPFTTSNKTSGIGLGLAITADLVKLHRGSIALVERGDVGTVFRVTLPCQQPSS